MKFIMNATMESGTNNKEKGVTVNIKTKKGTETIESDIVLLSIGRRPYTDGL